MNKYRLSLAGINAREGIERFNGNKNLYEKFLVDFINDSHFNELERALLTRDIDAAFAQAHALKGIAGNLSFGPFHELLVPFVDELREKNFDNACKSFGEVKAAYTMIIETISNEIIVSE